ncbi:hypothetical protein FQZ97_792190 [compost metagenome]
MGVEKLWIAFEGNVDINALTRDIDRPSRVSDVSPVVVPNVDLYFSCIGVPVVTTEHEGFNAVLFNKVLLQVFRCCVKQLIGIERFYFLAEFLGLLCQDVLERETAEQVAFALVDIPEHGASLYRGHGSPKAPRHWPFFRAPMLIKRCN